MNEGSTLLESPNIDVLLIHKLQQKDLECFDIAPRLVFAAAETDF